MPDNPGQSEAAHWFAQFDMGDMPQGSTFSIVLSNDPIEHWFYKRKKLRPESLKLELIVPSWGHWRLQLERHEPLYLAQWRPNDDLRIESQQLRYRKLVKWPRLASLAAFPQVVEQLERILFAAGALPVVVGSDEETLAERLQAAGLLVIQPGDADGARRSRLRQRAPIILGAEITVAPADIGGIFA